MGCTHVRVIWSESRTDLFKAQPYQGYNTCMLAYGHTGGWKNTSVSKNWLDFWIIRQLRNLRIGFLIPLKERGPLFGSIKNRQTRFFAFPTTNHNPKHATIYDSYNSQRCYPWSNNDSVSGESASLPGSGKTYTMMGSEHGPWISPYCLMNIDS